MLYTKKINNNSNEIIDAYNKLQNLLNNFNQIKIMNHNISYAREIRAYYKNIKEEYTNYCEYINDIYITENDIKISLFSIPILQSIMYSIDNLVGKLDYQMEQLELNITRKNKTSKKGKLKMNEKITTIAKKYFM